MGERAEGQFPEWPWTHIGQHIKFEMKLSTADIMVETAGQLHVQ